VSLIVDLIAMIDDFGIVEELKVATNNYTFSMTLISNRSKG
jgi:hypothetical protein